VENPRVRIRARYRHSSQFLRAVNIYSQNPTMDFPSENWVYNDWDDFDTVSANVVGDYTLEIFTQLRNTGSILDNFRCVLRGSKHLEINASLTDMILRAGSWNTSGPSSEDSSRQRTTRFCTGEFFIPFLQNQLAAKFEVPSINNQRYFQHTIRTLEDSKNQNYYQHTIVHEPKN
jgi:hypothetical protein